ncbi:probable methyltransferase-like protein 24 [Haliotis rufescens]|uniref:probable methyltransferase-like protein 24 n=1 Tax=Haliotis rufescens TaxID=6454 RepID=UPI00201E8B48|nr:probable methyltransferase-like protein 24 [Haliotis rufescens]
MQGRTTILLFVGVVSCSVGVLFLQNQVRESVDSIVTKMAASMQKAGAIPQTSNLHNQIQPRKMESHDIVSSESHTRVANIDDNDNSPLKNIRKEGHVVLPSKSEIERMSAEAAFRTYHSYLDNTDIVCHRKLRMGECGDGGWEICDDKEYRPVKPCIVYSFGINSDFSFDDDTAKSYECDVFSFDPSMKQASHQRSQHVRFLKLGISGTDKRKGAWQLHTLRSFKKMLNHTGKVIDVLKIDVEFSEWPSLPDMTTSGELFKVKQLLIEYHGGCGNKDNCIKILKILKDIHDVGFRKFYVHKNSACTFRSILFPVLRTTCYEVHYVNIHPVF